MCLGAQKDRLTETVLLSTQNICFGWEIRKIIFNYTLLSWGLKRLMIWVDFPMTKCHIYIQIHYDWIERHSKILELKGTCILTFQHQYFWKCSKAFTYNSIQTVLSMKMWKWGVQSEYPFFICFETSSCCDMKILWTLVKFAGDCTWPTWENAHLIAVTSLYNLSCNMRFPTMMCATRKASYQSAHMHSLIRAFASCLNILRVLSYRLSIIWSF